MPKHSIRKHSTNGEEATRDSGPPVKVARHGHTSSEITRAPPGRGHHGDATAQDEPSDAVAVDSLFKVEQQIGFILRKANQRHVAIFAAHIADLTPPQFAALSKLHDLGETSQNHLGTLIAMDAATVKGVVDRLSARGLVDVHKDEVDKRRLQVSLTDEGRRAVEDMTPIVRQITDDTLAPLSKEDARMLVGLLGKISG